MDFLDGKILVGHDNGRIITIDIEGRNEQLITTAHHDGECWGLDVIPEQGTFLTCGDDNEFHEISLREKRVLRSGKVWLPEHNDGKPYETHKIRSTASTLSSMPAHQQARAIAYSKHHCHLAVSNNNGDIAIFSYNDFSKKIATLLAPREWCEVMRYSPDGNFLAVGSHDDTVYVYAIEDDGAYRLHY
jgi:WD40 repeat protein